MNRIIKFRQKIHNGWHYWGFTESEGKLIFDGIITGGFFTIEEALKNSQQYTGLLDKNGKEIFEGDIVRIKYTHTSGKGKEYIAPIEWHDCQFQDGTEYYPLTGLMSEMVEVLGDIYSTPELLK